jgi:hypothetical protein
MAEEDIRPSTTDGIWLPAIVITTVNAALFLALFAGIAGL